jgi:hypothetical protein
MKVEESKELDQSSSRSVLSHFGRMFAISRCLDFLGSGID